MFRRIFFSIVLLELNLFAQDHSEFIEGPFERPQDVTLQCLDCHDVADEILESRHWKWRGDIIEDGTHVGKSLGKANFINNFCIAVTSNQPRCTSCHIGFGWKDDSFDFSNAENIDCLVCHEQTGTYVKVPTAAGMPAENVDLLAVAQSVANPTRNNCGICHFDGGGGTGVKHGDLDDSLYDPSPELDVHMGGLDYQCTDCHSDGTHEIFGASHASIAANENHFTCENCHEGNVHEKEVLNKHLKSVACETCHIPMFAKVEPTKIWWDWSTAGKEEDPKVDKYGKETYSKMKGDFEWEKNVQPVYAWYNGSADYYLPGDTVDGSVVKLNKLNGDISDPNAKIYPFKLMKGKQPYDPVNKYLIIPHLFGKEGYWKTYDWVSASEIGMEQAGLDFSGEVDFIVTEMYWPLNHMIAPANEAVKCTECHGSKEIKRMNFEELGYKGDPIKTGSRLIE
ncbi:MAG: tetrathionate reductase family octaheme c-type cytochrome [Melioribacteraceae bacterium]|nr:tetrathionate reductase family octaheme c-type cytochrome [Melioribacteraceae bacterium]